MAIREGRWDCDKCHTKGVLGRNKFCPNCGGQRPSNVRFYLPENEPAVTDSKRLAQAKAGPDWTCDACEQDNPGDAKFCAECGSSRDKSASRPIKDYTLGEIPRTGDEERVENTTQLQDSDNPSVSFWDKIKIPTAIAVGLALIAAAVFLLIPHPQSLTVTGHSWQRTVSIEEYRTVEESDWSIPIGGRYVSESREINHYDQVVTGTHEEPYPDCHQEQTGTNTYTCGSRDLGNGYFDDIECTDPVYTNVCTTEYRPVTDYKNVPVYATKYTYDIEKWVWERDASSSGNDIQPLWPDFQLSEKERESGRSEHYVVHLSDRKEKTYDYISGYSIWVSLQEGMTYEAKINGLGVITDISINK